MRSTPAISAFSGRKALLSEVMRLDAARGPAPCVLAEGGDASPGSAAGSSRRPHSCSRPVPPACEWPGPGPSAACNRHAGDRGAPPRGCGRRSVATRRERTVPHAVEEPVDLMRPTEEDAAQHQGEAPLGMGLGIGQRQGRAPGAAEDDPALDADQRRAAPRCRRSGAAVVLSIVSAKRRRTPRPALVEHQIR